MWTVASFFTNINYFHWLIWKNEHRSMKCAGLSCSQREIGEILTPCNTLKFLGRRLKKRSSLPAQPVLFPAHQQLLASTSISTPQPNTAQSLSLKTTKKNTTRVSLDKNKAQMEGKKKEKLSEILFTSSPVLFGTGAGELKIAWRSRSLLFSDTHSASISI